MVRAMAIAAVVVLAGSACTKDGGGSGSGSSAGSSSSGSSGSDGAAPAGVQPLLDAWKNAGLTPSAFAPAKSDVGTTCQSGTVAKLDVLICSFSSASDAKAAEDKGLAWVGDTTGVSRARGSLLVVIADRHKADPNGRTINQMMHAE
jgi:hypothetical protein